MATQLYNLTKPELDMFRELCNFTPDELVYFDMRASHKSHVQIGLENYWCDSKVSSLAKAVRQKIKRIKPDF